MHETHTDQWRCDRCNVDDWMPTSDLNYVRTCSICGKDMVLHARRAIREDVARMKLIAAAGGDRS